MFVSHKYCIAFIPLKSRLHNIPQTGYECKKTNATFKAAAYLASGNLKVAAD